MDNDTYIIGESVFNTNSKHFGKIVEVKIDIHPGLIRVMHDEPFYSKMVIKEEYYWSKELTVKVNPDTPHQRLLIKLKYA